MTVAVAGPTGVGRKVSRHQLQVINKRRVEESRAYFLSLLAFNLAVAGPTREGRKVSRHPLQIINKKESRRKQGLLFVTVSV